MSGLPIIKIIIKDVITDNPILKVMYLKSIFEIKIKI